MKKSFLLFGLLLLALSASAFSLKDWRNNLYEQIKTETIKGLKANFQTDVTVGRVRGLVIGQVVFEEVVVPGVAAAKKVTVDYDLLAFALHRDIVPAITRITVENGIFEIVRKKESELNVLALSPAADTSASPPPPFRATIRFKNCRINYQDQAGFRADHRDFSETIGDVDGRVSFNRKDRVYYSLTGELYDTPTPGRLKVSGATNFQTGDYHVNLTASRLDLARWGNYVIPYPPLNFNGGEADLTIRLGPPKTAGWPLSLVGSFDLRRGSAILNGYRIEECGGKLAMADDSVAVSGLAARLNGVPLTVNGRVNDFSRPRLDLKVALRQADLKKVAALFPETSRLDLNGAADAEFSLRGPADSLLASGSVTVPEGTFYNQRFAGRTALTLQKGLLNIEIQQLALYQGTAAGSVRIDFNRPVPDFRLQASFQQFDLAALAQGSPGVEGKARGELVLAGPLNRLNGELTGGAAGGLLFGQPIETLSAIFTISDGDIAIERVALSSPTASLNAAGRISRDLLFNFQANARGIRLAGEGFLGPMEATVDHFSGSVRWKLDDAFWSAPLRYLSAAGTINLSRGQIGRQKFDLAQGRISMGEGKLSVDNVILAQKNSVLQVSGQTGIGHPTDLRIRGERLALADLKILNYLLPEEAQDPVGQLDLAIDINGEIPKETLLTSLDPILDLSASGEATLQQTVLGELPVDLAIFTFRWLDRELSFPACALATANSKLDLSFEQRQGLLQGSLSGRLDLYEFRRFTERYGRWNGRLGLNLVVAGSVATPELSASFWLDEPRFNQLRFDSVEGSLDWRGGRLAITRPIRLSDRNSHYELSGLADLEPLLRGSWESASLDLQLKVPRAELVDAIQLAAALQGEFSRKVAPTDQAGKVRVDLRDLRFSVGNDLAQVVSDWEKLSRQVQRREEPADRLALGGSLQGLLSLRGKLGELGGEFDGQVNHGQLRGFTFDSLKFNGAIGRDRVTLDRFDLQKKSGKLNARGSFGFNNTVELELTCHELSLEIMKLLFPRDFQGVFNLTAALSGRLDDPDISASFSSGDPRLAGVPFESATLQLSKKGSQVFIHDFSLIGNNRLSRINGSLDLALGGRISIEAELKDNAVGLFNLVTDDLRWVAGEADASLQVGGTLAELDINGKVSLQNGVAHVRVIDAPLHRLSGEAVITNGTAAISRLTGFWQGESSRGHANWLGLAGSVDLRRLLAPRPMVDLKLTLSPAQLYVDLPNLYTGAVNLSRTTLAGPFYFDFSRGPKLKGEAEVNNALITLARRQSGEGKVFPLDLDLKLNLARNVYVAMGDVATLDLSNIFMNLEINSPELRVSGSLASPSLQGKVLLKRGTVTIFNREFSLLNTEVQQKYYPFSAEKIVENNARFSGDPGAEGLNPEIDLVAKVDVENSELEDGIPVTRKVTVLSRLRGVIGATDRERGLKVDFDSFVEDRSKGAAELKPGGYSEQEIKVMLLPDFIKSLAGISRGEGSEVDTNVVVADYLNSRLQAVVFRGLERELEQRLGLESLTLEYNFGKDIRQAMGITDTRVLEGERPDWRVGFVKGVFDKLYVDINYSRFNTQTEATAQEVFNYQLTYKLSPIWSIIYYREPASLQELTSGYQKATLKAGFSFW